MSAAVDPVTLAACSDPFCPACLAQIAANEAHQAALAGVCSHGGHGYDGETCSDIDDALGHVASYEPDDIYPSLVRAHCSCGWHEAGYVRGWLAEVYWQAHVAGVSAAPQ